MPITEFKIGLYLTIAESLSWCKKISVLTSIRHRNILLRVAHGEIYTKEKLARFGLSDSPTCPRCNAIENLQHKIKDCPYVKRIWNAGSRLLKEPLVPDPTLEDILGTKIHINTIGLTVRSEIIQRILQLKDNQLYLIHPRNFVENALRLLIRRETKTRIRDGLKDLLST